MARGGLIVELTHIKISNYRSIIKTEMLNLCNMTVVVGKNNQGKTNLVKAINLCFEVLENTRDLSSTRMKYFRSSYQYEKDFPLKFQSESNSKKTNVDLRFKIDEEESKEIYKLTGMSIKEYFDLVFEFDKSGSIALSLSKKGVRNDIEKTHSLVNYITNSIVFVYIPASRSNEDSLRVIDELIRSRLRHLELDRDYREALNVIEEKEKKILEEISDTTLLTLKEFLPEVRKSMIIKMPQKFRSTRSFYRRDFTFNIDDGTETDLDAKGDGIKSLVALALLKGKVNFNSHMSTIIIIEEPETHLHSGAIHQLNSILKNASTSSKIIITTHHPVFVSRSNSTANIVVFDNYARHAESVEELRQQLGVSPMDNLINSEIVIVVEGESDYVALSSLFAYYSETIKWSLSSNKVVIKYSGGASKMKTDIAYFKTMLCKVIAIYDHDEEGKKEAKLCIERKIVDYREVFFFRKPSSEECELEDLINPKIYFDKIVNDFGVDAFKFESKGKWNDRIKSLFVNSMKHFDDSVLKKCKLIVASAIQNNPSQAIIKGLEGNFLSIVKHVEEQVNQ